MSALDCARVNGFQGYPGIRGNSSGYSVYHNTNSNGASRTQSSNTEIGWHSKAPSAGVPFSAAGFFGEKK
jgi:hypothetical protein